MPLYLYNMPLYLYTVRRARIKRINKYVGLIPKLFSDMFDDSNIESGCDTSNRTNVALFKNDAPALTIFTNMLQDKSNLLYTSYNIDREDIPTIIRLNLDIYKKNESNNTYDKFIKFIEHLYRGHGEMDYGLYFGSLNAVDDLDFLAQLQRHNVTDSNQRIVLYITLDKLLNHIDRLKTKYSLTSPLVYFNSQWSYGKMSEKSMKYDIEHRKEFISYLETYDNHALQNSEIICQIPLDISHFKYTFGQILKT